MREVPEGGHKLCQFTDDWKVTDLTEHSCYLRSGELEARFQKRTDGEWEFDEIVGQCFLHIEQMDSTYYWLGIYHSTGSLSRLSVTIGSVSGRAAVQMKGYAE